MKAPYSLIAGVVLLGLASCQSWESKPSIPSWDFGYVAQGDLRNIGFVRALDDGQRTVLQFVTDPPANIRVVNQSGKPLQFDRAGQNLLLKGLHTYVYVYLGKNELCVVKSGKQAVPKLPQVPTEQVVKSNVQPPVAASQAVDPALKAAYAKLDVAGVQLQEIKSQLPTALTAGEIKTLDAKMDQVDTMIADAATVILRVGYGFGSANFKPSPEVVQTLIPAAKSAERVVVRGFTDSTVIDEANRKIAIARALGARQWLIGQGVETKKIRAYYNSAGKFIADNSTPAGRAINRRVEIELIRSKTKSAQAEGELGG